MISLLEVEVEKSDLKIRYNTCIIGEALDKIKIYVYSVGLSTLDFVDKEGAMHACAQAGSSAFSGLKHYTGSMDDRYLSDEEREAITIVESYCKRNDMEFEIVDVAKKGFVTKIKLKAKGLTNFPTITFKEKVIHGVPTEEELKGLLKKIAC